MARISGKYGKIVIALSKQQVTGESVGLNTAPITIDGKQYQAYQVGTIDAKFIIPDTVQLTISNFPAGISYVIDYLRGYIIFSEPLSSSTTITANYEKATDLVEVADMTDWSIDERVKELDVTSFGDEWEAYIPLQKSWDASITGHLNLILWNKALGGAGEGGIATQPELIYFLFYFNRNTINQANPVLVGCGLLSLSIKTPATGKVEFSAKVKGTFNLARFNSNPLQ